MIEKEVIHTVFFAADFARAYNFEWKVFCRNEIGAASTIVLSTQNRSDVIGETFI